ncbi:MAG: copper-binding protein [Roseibium sp.]|uniref:cupredoxin domain-containing protein n=1 Tax=Roseibium sp. TaxID=1936156 RepID=UPI0026076DA9|nr:plastocyanin/azurin family copper-binding protein [Roseibium sp.]MCV0426252.1 copper-binding protein [Roseibium sp.]
MCLNTFRLPAILLALLISVPALAEDDKTAAICAEAEDRYVDMFGHPSSEEEGVRIVKMYKYKFCPGDLKVPVGTTVRWVNVDKRTSHTVLLKETDTPESDRLFPEDEFEFTFLVAGPQNYLCGPHWETQEMIGMVTVTP